MHFLKAKLPIKQWLPKELSPWMLSLTAEASSFCMEYGAVAASRFCGIGRLEGSNDRAVINSSEWFPTWPNVPDAENMTAIVIPDQAEYYLPLKFIKSCAHWKTMLRCLYTAGKNKWEDFN